jgi:hypothetical protein
MRSVAPALIASTIATLAPVLVPLLASPPASAATSKPQPLRVTGHVSGNIAAGVTTTVTISAHDEHGWQTISEIDVELQLRGRTLDQVTLDPSHLTINVLGADQPQAAGLGGTVRGAFFQVNASAVGLSAKGNDFNVVLPIRLVAAPPPDARMYLAASDATLNEVGPIPLGPPTPAKGGFSWGTLLTAVIVALLAGGFFGGVFANRRRPPARPSVYTAVRRRLDHEREPAAGPAS